MENTKWIFNFEEKSEMCCKEKHYCQKIICTMVIKKFELKAQECCSIRDNLSIISVWSRLYSYRNQIKFFKFAIYNYAQISAQML